MVKVLIDGKEYEGRNVQVGGFKQCDVDYDFGNIFNTIIVKEPVQEFVSVPKEIQFVEVDDADINSFLLALKINKHYLGYNNISNNWELLSSHRWQEVKTSNCVLVPCKRSELKTGDWAVFQKYKDEPITQMDYCLILSKNKNVWVTETEDNEIRVNEELETMSPSIGNWFKVVPKSEVMG